MTKVISGLSRTYLKTQNGPSSQEKVAWEFLSPGGSYTGRLLIDGEIYSTSEATKKFLKK